MIRVTSSVDTHVSFSISSLVSAAPILPQFDFWVSLYFYRSRVNDPTSSMVGNELNLKARFAALKSMSFRNVLVP